MDTWMREDFRSVGFLTAQVPCDDPIMLNEKIEIWRRWMEGKPELLLTRLAIQNAPGLFRD